MLNPKVRYAWTVMLNFCAMLHDLYFMLILTCKMIINTFEIRNTVQLLFGNNSVPSVRINLLIITFAMICDYTYLSF